MALHTDPTGEDAQRLWQRFIDAALWPKGPLHLTHHLVVKARTELLEQGDNRYPVVTPATLKEARYLVEHCKRLLDVVVSLNPPIDSYTCDVKIYLCSKLMEIGSHRHGLDGNQRTVNSEIEKVRQLKTLVHGKLKL
ncbi:uncharacterized protein LOC127751521 [Frankliniella occidentalis]|uniref:Uncharacterized protein LOC127751521 n=1 Tax=Frankliniella occidentalis TaxID=133901 RepID=A0A9C6X8L7_FRAOC|nr:uncharacterized protein LOC127751521 [Frankliniella occidentalis]